MPTDMNPSARTFIKTYPALHTPRGFEAFRFSIKDLFDVAGEVTTAGSKILQDAAPATQDAVAVARLKAAGGVAVGRTNMSEFAFSGVGFNPHYGTPANPMLSASPYTERVTGGSSSGAAASVACGLADIGLGSDTGGSLRIPAALCGLVGFKPTARLVPTTGAFPLSTTLDTVGAITRDVPSAIFAHEVLAARKVNSNNKPLSAYKVAVVRNFFFEGADTSVNRVFESALQALTSKGLHSTDITLPELADIPRINASGGFSPIESYRFHKAYWDGLDKKFETQLAHYDPRVAQRILIGAKATDRDYTQLLQDRADWIAAMSAKLQDFDAVLSPTVPIAAPTIASIATDDTEFFRFNGLLLRNPAAVNLLDGCAISIPCQATGAEPVGMMIWHGAMHDDDILSLAELLEKMLAK